MKTYAVANSWSCNPIAQTQLAQGPLSSCIQPACLFDLCLSNLVYGAVVATQDRLRMQAHTVPIATCLRARRILKIPSAYPCMDTLRVCLHDSPPLAHHVLHILYVRTKKEARFVVDACLDIACMEHKQAFWGPFSCFEEPADDVRAHIPFLVGCGAKIPVAVRMGCASPQPTETLRAIARGLVDLTPEACRKGLVALCQPGCVVTRRRAVFPDGGLPRHHGKGLTAWGIGTGQHLRKDARLLSRQASACGRTIPDSSTLGFARHGLKGLRTWLVGTEELDTGHTMSRHGMTSLYGQSGVVRLPHGQGPRRTLSGGATSNLTNARVYNICSHTRRF